MGVLTNGVILTVALGAAAGGAIGGHAGSFGTSGEQPRMQVVEAGDHGMVDAARALLGTPYVFGGATPAGVDQSGLVKLAFAEVGVPLPHSIAGQDEHGQRVGADEARPGDLVVADSLREIGIYIGDGQMIAVRDEPGASVSIVPVLAEPHHFTRLID